MREREDQETEVAEVKKRIPEVFIRFHVNINIKRNKKRKTK